MFLLNNDLIKNETKSNYKHCLIDGDKLRIKKRETQQTPRSIRQR